jgi:hypothetical protein
MEHYLVRQERLQHPEVASNFIPYLNGPLAALI